MNPDDPLLLCSNVREESSAATLLRIWQQGEAPDLDEFLATLSSISPRELAELVRIDLDAHWERGHRPQAEGYLQRYSAIAADPELALDVIYAEFLARETAGEYPRVAEYQRRFPEFARVLEEQIGLHAALDSFDQDAKVSDLNEASTEATYEILEQIGSGGMGVVYKARQAALNRLVALKMVRAIDASNPELLARFRSEAQVVALLRHPNIVQVYDCGEHDGLPYLTMELVEGGTLSDRLNGAAWQPRAAAELIVMLADAVQYAHDHHVIHRDLKPANVLVSSDADPLEVKITDFGLAKLLADGSSQHTRSHSFLGTPSYMSPEQATGRQNQIGPATDVYSLGAIFFELLTGQPPFRGETPMDTLRMVLNDHPPSVLQLAPHAPRDLSTICDKCLEREPGRRYQSASELKADVERYLQGKPIHARKSSNLERTWRWSRRNPLLAAALGLVALLLVGIAGISLAYSARLSGELKRSQTLQQAERTAHESAQQRLWDSYLSEASALNRSHSIGQRFDALKLIDKATALLDTVGRNPRRELRLRNAVLAAVALPDMRKTRTIDVRQPTGVGCSLSLEAGLFTVVTAEGRIAGYRWSDGAPVWTIDHGVTPVGSVFSSDGEFLAAVDPSGVTVYKLEGDFPRSLWRADGAERFSFALDGEHAAYSATRDGMRLVRLSSGEVVRSVGKGQADSSFVFEPKGKRIAVCSTVDAQIVDAQSGAIAFALPIVAAIQPQVAWHPGGRFLAVWADNSVAIWDVELRQKIQAFSHRGLPSRMTFNSDGSILALETAWNNRMVAWNVSTAQRLLDVSGRFYHATQAARDGSFSFLTLNNGSVDVWELTPGACKELAQNLDIPVGYRGNVDLSPEGRIIAFSSQECLELWDARSLRRLWAQRFGDCKACFDSEGRLLLSCEQGVFRFARHLSTLPANTAGESPGSKPQTKTVVLFDSPERLTDSIVPWTLSINTSGQTMAYLSDDGTDWIVASDAAEKPFVVVPDDDPRMACVSDDNRYVAIAGWERGGAGVWDAQSGQKLAQLKAGVHAVPLFSPDGKFLATSPNGVELWRTGDWKLLHRVGAAGTTPAGLGMAFSPDSRVLAVANVSGPIDLVDPATGRQWGSLASREPTTSALLEFSHDQRWLIASPTDERTSCQVWNIEELRKALVERGLDWPAEVLQAGDSEPDFEEHLEIRIEDQGIFSRKIP